MLEEAKGAVLASPVVIAMPVIAGEDPRRRRTSGGFEPPLGDTLLQRFELLRTRSMALARCVHSNACRSSGVDDEHVQRPAVGGHFLDECLRRVRLLAGGDADGTLDQLALFRM